MVFDLFFTRSNLRNSSLHGSDFSPFFKSNTEPVVLQVRVIFNFRINQQADAGKNSYSAQG